MIRRATVLDIEGMLALGKRAHARMTPGTYPPIDDLSCKRMAAMAVQSKQYITLVDERDGTVYGMLFGTTDRLAYSLARYATDVLFISERAGAGIQMLREFVRWARAQNVYEITCGVSSGEDSPRMDALYRRLGFTKIGGMFQMKGSL